MVLLCCANCAPRRCGVCSDDFVGEVTQASEEFMETVRGWVVQRRTSVAMRFGEAGTQPPVST